MARWTLSNRVQYQVLRLMQTALLLLVASLASATVRHVPGDFPTIQQAIDASTSGDEVLVAPGTYGEQIQLIGPAADGIRLASTDGAEVTTIRPVRDPFDPLGILRPVTCIDVGPSTIIEGFTITGGSAINISTFGGGMLLRDSDAIVRNNLITDNHSGNGAGIWVGGGAPTISGNTIFGNSAQDVGGGISWNADVGGRILNNVVVANSAGFLLGRGVGGGIWVGAGSPEISGCTIAGNRGARGTGIFINQFTSPTVSRTILAFNVIRTTDSQSDGTGLEVAPGGNLAITCSDVFGNDGGNYSGISDPTGTIGNQSADPLFCDLQGRDFSISGLSPCAPAHNPSGCGLVGALPPSCSVTPAVRTSWGKLKARYR